MSERKVLNKYYPPDYDPSKIPKCKNKRSTTFAIRIMAPFNMRCNNCGEYIYKGKKFNSRKEDVTDEDYLGLRIYRFYIKCPRCVSEIAFKTDLTNCDYALEAGATRNFEAAKTAELMARREIKEKEEEELNNPMKVLENRTKASQREMEQLDELEELKDMNARAANVSHEDMIQRHVQYEKTLARLQEEHDEQFVQSLFGKDGETKIKRLADPADTSPVKKAKLSANTKPTDHLAYMSNSSKVTFTTKSTAPKSRGGFSAQSALAGFIKKKKT